MAHRYSLPTPNLFEHKTTGRVDVAINSTHVDKKNGSIRVMELCVTSYNHYHSYFCYYVFPLNSWKI